MEDRLTVPFPSMNATEGLFLAQCLKEKLLERGYPVRQVYLFGSVARGEALPGSDINLAVVSEPFRASKRAENDEFLTASREIHHRIVTVCLHPEDFDARTFSLAQEVERDGIGASAALLC